MYDLAAITAVQLLRERPSEQFSVMNQAICMIFLLAAAFSVSHGADFEELIGTERAGLEEPVKQLIEEMREKLKAGIPDLGIPPMDPLDLKHKNIDIAMNNSLKLNGCLKDVKGKNLLAFNVTNLEASVYPISFVLGLSWEPIDVKGHYNIDGHLLNIIPIYGNGPFEGWVEGVFVYARIVIGSKAGRLQVKKMDVNFGVKDIKVKIHNFLGSTLGDIICEIINENLPTWIEQFRIGYLPGIKDRVVKEINNFLKDMSVDELLDFILGFLKTTTAAPDSTTPALH